MRPGLATALATADLYQAASLNNAYGGIRLDPASGNLTITSAPDIDAWADVANFATYGSWTQATAGQKPHSVTVNGKPTVTFDGSASQLLINDKAASVFNWLHAAAGNSGWVVCRFTGGTTVSHIFDTCNNNTSQHGININVNASNGNVSFRVVNGSGGGNSLISAADAAAMTVNEWALVEWNWTESVGYVLRTNGGDPVAGLVNGSASATDATGAPRLGSLVAGLQYLTGGLAWLQIVPGIPVESQIVAQRALLMKLVNALNA